MEDLLKQITQLIDEANTMIHCRDTVEQDKILLSAVREFRECCDRIECCADYEIERETKTQVKGAGND